ncbi:MAG TPA: hypothetical protein VMM76_03990 [Pirellulaceae bacterium]|nr:hypothetical protein [Pirellulaceae bacterium]
MKTVSRRALIMSLFSARGFGSALVATLVYGLLLSGMPKASAEEAKGVERTFAVEVSGSSLDFLSAESLRVVVAPNDPLASDTFLSFADSNSDQRFNSTVWEHQHAMHITTAGANIPGFVVWLLTPDTPAPPPIGSFTITGEDSPLILSQEVVYIKQCKSTTCPGNYTDRVQVGTASDNDGKLVVVTAIFSR